ncbi:MAG: hypothetical protein ACOCRK_05110 [bacterium]
MRITNLLKENKNIIDNKEGLGSVPLNLEIDYMGLRVEMKPSIFLDLAAPLENPQSANYIEEFLKDGGKIGAPFLQIKIPPEWEDGDFSKMAKVQSHEGRNRMIAVKNLYGDIPVETHLLFSYGVRNRDLTPEIIDNLNARLLSETNRVIKGKLFVNVIHF